MIGPYFVDWTAYRDSFEREASAYIGRPVNVAGKASVRLLPTPVLSFTNIRIGDLDDPDMDVERFRAEVELAPLLKGEVRIIQMAIERPQFRIDLAGLGEERGVFGGAWRIDPERISLARLEVREGTAEVTDSRTGRSWQADGVNAIVEADSLRGPGRLEATLTLDGELISVRAGVGSISDLNSVSANMSVSSPHYPLALSADGALHFPASGPPSFEGTATVEGAADSSGEGAASPWRDFRASGPVTLTRAALEAREIQVSYGGTERPLIVQASGRVELDSDPRFDVSVAARQIDIDRTLGPAGEAPPAISDAINMLIGRLPDVPIPAIPGTLRLNAQGVVLGGGVVSEVGIDLASAGDSFLVRDFTAMLPGETRVALQGELGVRPLPTFRGKGRVESRRPPAFATWWRGSVGSAARLGAFALEADLDLSSESQKISNLVATTDTGVVRGAVELRRFQDTGQLFVNVDLSADRADATEARAFAELLSMPSALSADIGQMIVSLNADTLSAGGIDAQSVVVEGGYENGRLDLRRLSVADLQGASIDAIGHVEDPFGKRNGSIEASVQASDLSGAAAFLARLLPENGIAAKLVSVAPNLSPVRAEISAVSDAAGGDLRLDVTGSFADTHLTVNAAGTGTLADPASLDGTVKVHADSEDTATVLAQLGMAPLSVRSGPLNVDADFSGRLAEGGSLKLSGTVAGVDLTYSGETKLADGRVSAAGDFEATTADIDNALLLAGIAVPGIGEGHAASASGRLELGGDSLSIALKEASFAEAPVAGSIKADWAEKLALSGGLELQSASLPVLAGFSVGNVPRVDEGAWSDAPFAPPMPGDLALDVTLDVASLDLGAPVAATNAKVAFRLDGTRFDLDLMEADFAGGNLKGTIGATLTEGEAAATIGGALTGGQLQALVWERSGLPVASGTLDASIEATGQGRSMAGIMATLDGSGAFAVSDGRLNALDPMALTDVMKAAEGEQEPDETEARETFASRFDSGAFVFGRAAGSFALTSGVMSVPKVSLEGEAATVLADATLDLNALTLDSGWTVRVDGAATQSQPYVTLSYSGAVADPERQVDLHPLLDMLRSRFLQRQLDQIEILEEERRRAEAREAAAVAREKTSPAVVTEDGSSVMESSPASAEDSEGVSQTGSTERASDRERQSGSGTLRESDVLLTDEVPSGSPAPAQPAAPASEPAAAPPAGPALNIETVAPELTAPPAATQPAAKPTPPAAEPAPRRSQRARRQQAPAPPPPPPAAAAPPASQFKTLPNGVVVKIR